VKNMYCPHKRKMVKVNDDATVCFEPKEEVCRNCFFNKEGKP